METKAEQYVGASRDQREQRDRDHRGNGNRVLGYAPVLILKDSREMLNDFRWAQMPVDLRIERSMVSAAVELVLEDGELKAALLEKAREKIREEGRECGARDGNVPGYVAVLIRDGLKHQVRYLGSTNNLSDHMYQMERILVTAAIELVVKSKLVHEQWVGLIANTVKWEVGHCYRSQKVG
jgi:hypothetical protein